MFLVQINGIEKKKEIGINITQKIKGRIEQKIM